MIARKHLVGYGNVAILAMTLVAAPSVEAAQPAVSPAACPYSGTWFGVNSLGTRYLLSALPLDANNRSVQVILTVTEHDVSLGGLFPTAAAVGTAHGQAIRSGNRSFGFALTAPGTDPDHRLLYFLETHGTMVFRDCDTYDATGSLSVFLSTQDRDGDGYVDEGEHPVSQIPFTCTIRRKKDKKFKLHFLTGFLIRRPSPLPGCPFRF
jgi:hypothetical protein